MAVAIAVPTHNPLTLEPFPKWLQDDLKKQPKSNTSTVSELRIHNSPEVIHIPVMTSTRVCEVKQMLAARLGVDFLSMQFVVRQGCSFRKQTDLEEVGRKVIIRGIESFVRQKKRWAHPIVIIGAGHAGLRQAMFFLKHGDTNFVLYDRKDTVGGTSWWDQANTTSKLQTEMGTYHLQYDEDNPVPTDMSPWPTRDELLVHFRKVSEEYGIIPYCRFQTDVRQIVVDKLPKEGRPTSQWWLDQNYVLSIEKLVDGKKQEVDVTHSAVIYYPGNLTVPREEVLRGEEQFDGYIEYAIKNTVDYSRVSNEEVVLVGHGAFAVENVRTCCEFGAKKVWMVCRRKNLACPRICSWLINQSLNFISGLLYLKACEHMYNLTPFDPWTYHSVYCNEKRTHVSINQKARFGIGDVYFLAIAMGMLEVVEDKIKRLSQHTVHLEGGDKIECKVLLKLLGFNGAWEVDRLIGCKEMEGWWVNSDFRRFLIAEPIGVNASNFGGTSFSPGVRSWVEHAAYFIWFPKDFIGVLNSGLLPKHKAEPDKDRPAYVIDARHGSQTSFVVDGSALGLIETSGVRGRLKKAKQLECHPPAVFLEQCKAEWDAYAQKWKAAGAPGEIPEYPYTPAVLKALLTEDAKEQVAIAARTGG